MFDFPENAYKALDVLEDAGYEAWFVGGCVRDAMLGRPLHDIDITTIALWPDAKRAFMEAGFRVVETGTKHGTITALLPSTDDTDDNEILDAFEITTYRIDSTSYSDARHPDSVEFVRTVQEDLARRDFTMNAMAYHPTRGLMDPFNGRSDLKEGIIRAVGDPRIRFKEDALRILRACRFSAQLGFSIDPHTYEAMLAAKSFLAQISMERISSELDGFVLGAFAGRALMETVDVLSYVLPELVAMKDCAQVTRYHIYDVLEHTAHALEAATPHRLVRWAALCHDMGKPAAAFFGEEGAEHFYGHAHVSAQIARGMLHRLLMNRSFIDRLCMIVSVHSDKIAPTSRSVKKALAKVGGDVELFRALLQLKRADMLAHAPAYAQQASLFDELEAILDDIMVAGDAFRIEDLAINGTDLVDAGIPQSPQIGELLQAALDACIEGELPNERDDLLGFCLARREKTASAS